MYQRDAVDFRGPRNMYVIGFMDPRKMYAIALYLILPPEKKNSGIKLISKGFH